MPKTACPRCKQQIEFNAEDIGLTATCPYCGVDFELRAKKKVTNRADRAGQPVKKTIPFQQGAGVGDDDLVLSQFGGGGTWDGPEDHTSAVSKEPSIRCPKCANLVEYEINDSGNTRPCPHCGKLIVLPANLRQKIKNKDGKKKPDWRDTGVVHHVPPSDDPLSRSDEHPLGCLFDMLGPVVFCLWWVWALGGFTWPSTNNNDFSGDAGQEAASETLLIAAQNGNIKAVKRHLASGADVDEIMLGQTPLYSAAHFGYKEIAELLIANGANVNFRSQILFGKTPLHEAASEGYKDIVKLLIANGANVNAKESLPSRRTPLYGAIHDGHKEIVQMLIANGANINVNANSENGPSPLEWAISFEQSEIASILRSRGAISRL